MNPDELRQRIAARTPTGWYGLAVGEGWFPIVDEADQRLAAINPDYEVHQIKEKFGGLRYYIGGIDHDASKDIIAEAEAKAEVTCEVCGAPGTMDNHGHWLQTLCEEHKAARRAKK